MNYSDILKILKGMQSFDCCSDFTRDWRETKDGKFPASNHSPMCKNYVTKKFVQIYIESSGVNLVDYVGSLDLIKEVLDDDDLKNMKVEYIDLTQDQFDRLEEFKGF